MSGDLDDFASDLQRMSRRTQLEVRAAVFVGAKNIRRDAAQLAGIRRRADRHTPHYPRSIDFDLREDPAGYEAEIGPNRDKPQGTLGMVLELGTSTSGPRPHLMPAFNQEVPRFLAALAAIIAREGS